MKKVEDHNPLSKRSQTVLRTLLSFGVKSQKISEIDWRKLKDATGFSSKDIVYGLVRLLTKNIIRYRLSLLSPQTLSVSLKNDVQSQSLRTYVNVRTKRNLYINKKRTKRNVTYEDKPVQKINLGIKKKNTESEVEKSANDSHRTEKSLAEKLAYELCEQDRLDYYQKLVTSYPERLIHKALEDCKKVPDERIYKNRAALFKSLLNRYAKNTT